MAINTVIFDFGQVMVHFEPRYMTEMYIKDTSDAALAQQVIFDRLYWDRLDSGDITDEEVVAACRERLPERLWADMERVYYNWIYNIPEIDGMRDIVRELKQRGIKVYLLSNICKYFAAHAHEIDALSDFDGCVFSAEIGMVKPHAEIFEYICNKYGIIPDKAVFVDDNEANIRGARAYGIGGYLFDGDAEKLREFLWEETENKE